MKKKMLFQSNQFIGCELTFIIKNFLIFCKMIVFHENVVLFYVIT